MNLDIAIEDDQGNDISDYVPIRIERHEDRFIAYTDDDDIFLAQSSDIDELFDRMRERLGKDTKFRVDDDKGAEYVK